MIIDAFVQMGPTLANYTDVQQPLYDATTADKLISLLDRFHIDMAIVHAPRWVGGSVFDPTYEKANSAIRDATSKFPKRLLGYGRVNPNWGEAAVAEWRRQKPAALPHETHTGPLGSGHCQRSLLNLSQDKVQATERRRAECLPACERWQRQEPAGLVVSAACSSG